MCENAVNGVPAISVFLFSIVVCAVLFKIGCQEMFGLLKMLKMVTGLNMHTLDWEILGASAATRIGVQAPRILDSMCIYNIQRCSLLTHPHPTVRFLAGMSSLLSHPTGRPDLRHEESIDVEEKSSTPGDPPARWGGPSGRREQRGREEDSSGGGSCSPLKNLKRVLGEHHSH